MITREEVGMPEDKLNAVARRLSPFVCVVDIQGEISSFSEKALTDAYEQAAGGHTRSVLFNFTGLTYMNSLGIGMLVMLLVRARREGKKILGFGLNEHYRNIFQITRLDTAIPIYFNEETALAAAEPFDLPEREA
jgi:anti-sigma B factor antagonist